MEPIAGLVHHGSGPSFTSLLHDNFATGLAAYAKEVALRFPWIKYYTPVNEPLTTARFSGLYGSWFPHHKSAQSFSKMLLNQLKGIVLSMQAIREVNKDAHLVQTEDLAFIHSTPLLAYQAAFENERRWLTYDILCGLVDEQHYFWKYFIENGIDESMLKFFLDNPCPPDIAGFNYYVTSERFLDENTQAYSPCHHGTNGRHKYADVPAVRATRPAGLESLLKQAWQRYRIPMALTEVHMNCTREEQMRWLKEAFDICKKLNEQQTTVKAITVWSLLGAYDWDSLLTAEDLHYEAGVFDITNNQLRPTALASMIRTLAANRDFDHPVLLEKGWWHKSYPGAKSKNRLDARPILILGSGGTLGSAFVKLCERRSLPCRALGRLEADITDPAQVEAAINLYRPWAVINTAGYVKVDDAESCRDLCFQLNSTAPAQIASICKKYGLPFLTFSSDLVFDGKKNKPYTEKDPVMPLNTYGKSKAEGERLVSIDYADALIIRTSSFFGPWDRYNFAYYVLDQLQQQNEVTAVSNIIVSPTYVPHLADKALDLMIDNEKGIWHLTNEGSASWYDLAGELAGRGGFQKKQVISCAQEQMNWQALRPENSALKSNRGIKLPSLEKALSQYFEEKVF